MLERTRGLRKGLGWREESGEGQGTSTRLPAALRSRPQQPLPPASPTAVGPLWISVSRVLTKAWGMPAQQAEPPKLRGSGRTKQRERGVLTGQRPPAFRAIRAGPRRQGHHTETQAVQRELGE